MCMLFFFDSSSQGTITHIAVEPAAEGFHYSLFCAKWVMLTDLTLFLFFSTQGFLSLFNLYGGINDIILHKEDEWGHDVTHAIVIHVLFGVRRWNNGRVVVQRTGSIVISTLGMDSRIDMALACGSGHINLVVRTSRQSKNLYSALSLDKHCLIILKQETCASTFKSLLNFVTCVMYALHKITYGSLIILITLRPEMVPASLVACLWASLK